MSLFSQTTQSLRLSPMYITWLILHICYVNIALIFFITFAQMTLSKCSIWHKVLELWHCFKASGYVAQHETLRTLAELEFVFFLKNIFIGDFTFIIHEALLPSNQTLKGTKQMGYFKLSNWVMINSLHVKSTQ